MSKPVLYLMFGYPGAGKTTAARVLSEITGATHLSSDKRRMELFTHPTFSQAEHAELYNTLDAETEELLKQGKSVIYDANLNRHRHRAEKYAICERTAARAQLLWIKTSRELAKERASHIDRLHLVPQGETPPAMFDRIAGVIEEPGSDEPYIELDGTQITPEYVKGRLRF